MNKFVVAIKERRMDIVEQMIMGAGKTTVISPLVGLLLSVGDCLVMQVRPFVGLQALLMTAGRAALCVLCTACCFLAVWYSKKGLFSLPHQSSDPKKRR